MISESTIGHRPARVAVVGDNTIDRFLNGSQQVLVGGNALNVAAQLALAGDAVAYFGAVAADADGAVVRAALTLAGLDDDHVVDARGVTAVTEIRILDDGDRVFEREDFGVTADYFPTTSEIDEIAASDWVHIGMLPRADELRRRIRQLNPNATISQDLGVAPGIHDLDVAFASAAVLEGVEPAGELARLRSAGIATVIVTLGAAGSIAQDATGSFTQRAAPAVVVDTTGAGDTFIAGFIHARRAGADLQTSMSTGAEWAAVTCGHVGGWPQK